MSILATIDALHAELDAHPDAHDTRRILADALEEAGGEWAALAEGYRALAALRVRPCPSARENVVYAQASDLKQPPFAFRANGGVYRHVPQEQLSPFTIAADWLEAMPWVSAGESWSDDYTTRRAAEDAAALAFSKLPEARRRELLAAAHTEGVTT